jgi:hypothetical protein
MLFLAKKQRFITSFTEQSVISLIRMSERIGIVLAGKNHHPQLDNNPRNGLKV